MSQWRVFFQFTECLLTLLQKITIFQPLQIHLECEVRYLKGIRYETVNVVLPPTATMLESPHRSDRHETGLANNEKRRGHREGILLRLYDENYITNPEMHRY